AVHGLVADHAGQHQGEGDIEQGADDQRSHDAERDVALGVLRLLGGGRDGVEPDIGEEDGRCAADDAADPEFAELARIFRYDRHVVGGVDIEDADGDHRQHDRHLDDDDDVIDQGGFGDAAYQDHRHHDDDEDGAEIQGQRRAADGSERDLGRYR